MKHLFLTGDIQIGKSTVINKTLELLKLTPGGFRTYFGPDRASPDKLLYMNSAAEPLIYHPDKAVVRFCNGAKPLVNVEKFNTLGTTLIRSAAESSPLILMDECGSLEKEALLFQREILACLNQTKPVLGVIKQDSRGWTDHIRNHPAVLLITVTKQNRDSLPSLLTSKLSRLIDV